MKKLLAYLLFLVTLSQEVLSQPLQSLEGLIDNSPQLAVPSSPLDKMPVLRNRKLYHSPLSILRQSMLQNPVPGTVFVRANGNDSFDCLAATQTGGHGPCATVQAALTAALAKDAASTMLVVDVGEGTFSAPIAVNGANVGGASSANFITAALSMPVVLIRGAGSGLTEIFGPATYKGVNYCYAILANGGAVVGLQGLSVRADGGGGSCLVSDLYVQAASMWIFGDVVLKSATGAFLAMEENALFYVTAGSTTPGLTLNGNAYVGFNIDANSTFAADSEIVLVGPMTMSGNCFIGVFYHSVFKTTIPNPAFTSGVSVSGRRFCTDGLSVIVIGNPPAVFPGDLLGIAGTGSRYYAQDATACVGGTAGCPATSAPTGFGAGATFATSDGSGAYGGAIQITVGTAPATSGGINIGLPYELDRGSCTPWYTQGTGSWNPKLAPSGFTTDQGLGISWDGDGTALPAAGTTIFVGYTCNTTQ